MASGAGAPNERPPGDGSPPGKPSKGSKPRAPLSEISEAVLKKHGISIVRAKPKGSCGPVAKRQTAKKCGWYVGDEGHEVIDIESSPEGPERKPTHVIFLSSDSEESSSPGSPSRASTPCGATRTESMGRRQRLPTVSPNSDGSSPSAVSSSADSASREGTTDDLPLVVAWPIGTTPPPHIRDPTALMWGLSPGEGDDSSRMECDGSRSPPENYVDSDEVPWSSPENLCDEPMDGESERGEDPCSD